MKLLGIDPGLAACGIAVVELEPEPRVMHVEVVRTAPSQKKRRLRSADDMGSRLRTIAQAIGRHLDGHVVAICAESKAIPFRNGRMQVKPSVIVALGRVRGVLDGFGAMFSIPIIEETPQALKKLLCGKASAKKSEVQAAVEARFPETCQLWPAQKTLHEHAADAVAACVAGIDSDLVRAFTRMRNALVEIPISLRSGPLGSDRELPLEIPDEDGAL